MTERKPFFRPRLAFSAGRSLRAAEEHRARQFRELVLPHMDGAYNFARYLSRDAIAAEDIVQEAFLRAFKAFPTYRGGAPKAWLFAIVRNCFLTWASGRSQAGRVLLDEPLIERQKVLRQLPFAPPVLFARQATLDVSGEDLIAALDREFLASRERGNEGLMVKDPRSPYRPGRRGMEWLKVKRALRTLDVVVTAVEWGHGKRKDVLSDYTFAIRDGDRLRNVGKAYSGLTDKEIAEMTKHFQAATIKDTGRLRIVRPDTVIEVAFDQIQRSDRHDSGYAMRFPRIVRLRPDKPVDEIDTLDTVRQIAGETGEPSVESPALP